MGISRRFFLFLSRAKGLRKVVSGWGFARRAARRFVAGETAAEAIAVARRIRTGQLEVNGGRFNPLAPFGGYKTSGNGRELGRAGLDEFLETKAIQLPA